MNLLAQEKRVHVKPLDLTGGESVYCINHAQMGKARPLLDQAAPDSALAEIWARIHKDLGRNEQAALAFCLIEELNAPRDRKIPLFFLL